MRAAKTRNTEPTAVRIVCQLALTAIGRRGNVPRVVTGEIPASWKRRVTRIHRKTRTSLPARLSPAAPAWKRPGQGPLLSPG